MKQKAERRFIFTQTPKKLFCGVGMSAQVEIQDYTTRVEWTSVDKMADPNMAIGMSFR